MIYRISRKYTLVHKYIPNTFLLQNDFRQILQHLSHQRIYLNNKEQYNQFSFYRYAHRYITRSWLFRYFSFSLNSSQKFSRILSSRFSNRHHPQQFHNYLNIMYYTTINNLFYYLWRGLYVCGNRAARRLIIIIIWQGGGVREHLLLPTPLIYLHHAAVVSHMHNLETPLSDNQDPFLILFKPVSFGIQSRVSKRCCGSRLIRNQSALLICNFREENWWGNKIDRDSM